MFVNPHSLDIDPTCRLVAHEALIDSGMGFSGHLGGYHVEMHHVMTRRGLMALSAVHRLWARVSELRKVPGRALMARGAVRSKKSKMPVLVLMTGGAIESRFQRGKVGVAQWACSPNLRLFAFLLEVAHKRGQLFIFDGHALCLSHPELGQRPVVHYG